MSIGDKMIFGNHTVMSLINTTATMKKSRGSALKKHSNFCACFQPSAPSEKRRGKGKSDLWQVLEKYKRT